MEMASSIGWTRLLVLVLAAASVLGATSSSYCGKEKIHTKGPVYWTDVILYPNATNFIVGSINGSKTAVTFGDFVILDDPLRLAPEFTSPVIGRLQGFFAYADPDLVSGPSFFSIVFPEGAITLNCYFKEELLLPNNVNRCGITTGNGEYSDITKGYVDVTAYSIALDEHQFVLGGTLNYCL